MSWGDIVSVCLPCAAVAAAFASWAIFEIRNRKHLAELRDQLRRLHKALSEDRAGREAERHGYGVFWVRPWE